MHAFAPALPIVAQTDLVLTAPAALTELVPAGVRVVPCPVALPDHAIAMVWHPRAGEDLFAADVARFADGSGASGGAAR